MKAQRVRRSFAQLFVDKLEQLSGGEQRLIGNRTVKEALGWDDGKYERIRTELLSQRRIIVGRGQGGTVGLASVPGTKALSAFISYSHVDEEYRSELAKHLVPLQRLQLIDSWHDRKISAGQEWDGVISTKLNQADIILLLVSIDFINSKYCYDIELERALERYAAGEAVVIPIILRSCMWSQTPFSRLQAVPRDARPVALWPDRDEAFVNVAEAVRQVAEERLSAR